MAFQFPSSPTIGQTITNPTSSVIYTWNGVAWASTPVTSSRAITASYANTGGSVTISDTAPTGVGTGSLWFDSDNMGLFVNYYDNDGAQWVATSTPGPVITASFAATASIAQSVGLLQQNLNVNGALRSTQSFGDEGGELFLAKSQTNTTINGGVVIDVFQNKLRIFEAESPFRGGYYDMTTLANGVGTNLTAPLYFLQAYASVTYALPGGYTVDPCRYSVVDINTNVPSNWFNTTNYRFTPQKAGYWEILASYDVYRGTATEGYIYIQKNGFIQASMGSFGAVNQTISKIIYLNGTTDYIQISNAGGASQTRSQDSSKSWFQAKWVGE